MLWCLTTREYRSSQSYMIVHDQFMFFPFFYWKFMFFLFIRLAFASPKSRIIYLLFFFCKIMRRIRVTDNNVNHYHIQKYCYSDKIRELIFSFDFSRPLLGVSERTNTPQLSTRHLLKRCTRYERRERWRSRHVHGEYSLYLAYI